MGASLYNTLCFCIGLKFSLIKKFLTSEKLKKNRMLATVTHISRDNKEITCKFNKWTGNETRKKYENLKTVTINIFYELFKGPKS